MSKYDETIAISHEEEGTYHRREVEPSRHHHHHQHTSSKPVTTYHTERYLVEDDRKPSPRSGQHKSLVKSGNYTSDEDDKDNFEEWTTSKRKVNHKTRQVETRVSRQLLVENGKVIADSGPQVTTRIKEDNKVEECEKEKTPKNKGKFEALEAAPEGPEGSCPGGRVLGEKKEIQRVSREVREENMQYHDERFKELTGRDVHQKAIRAPHELITINDKHHAPESAPRGKMVHYSNRGKKYQDTDEILEVAKLAIDGSVTKEVKRTHNHEEFSEDEKPDERGEAEELRAKPVVQRSSRKHVDYVNDYDDMRTPEASDNDEREVYDSRGGHANSAAAAAAATGPARRHRAKPLTSAAGASAGSSARHRHHNHDSSDEAFPRYDLDPLLDSLRDEDYRPAPAASSSRNSGRIKEVALQSRRRGDSSASSSDDEQYQRSRGRSRPASGMATGHKSPAAGGSTLGAGQRVEIPEVYRVNKQRLLAGKSSSRERSYSPQQQQQRVVHTTTSSKTSRRDGRNQRGPQRREDAATQAHLTDEEIERHSIRSSEVSGGGAGGASQAKAARHLERQSTPNASRRYYYGNAADANRGAAAAPASGKRRTSVTSSASSSDAEDARARARQQGVRSRDSGFRSPHQREHQQESPDLKQQDIYSVSSKARAGGAGKNQNRGGAASPTPTTGSAGQRSVKTTTTTLSAGLADRPGSRARRQSDKVTRKNDDQQQQQQRRQQKSERVHTDDDGDQSQIADEEFEFQINSRGQRRAERQQPDTISISSLKGPNATKIKVPYRHVIEIQQEGAPLAERQRRREEALNKQAAAVEKSSSEMSLQEDIESLSKRLANISEPPRHFDYKTVVQSVPHSGKQQQQQRVVDSYNVRTLEQNSPFQRQQPATVKDNNNSPTTSLQPLGDNNNETDFSLSDYHVKSYRATPALVHESALLAVDGKQSGRAPGTTMMMDDNDDDDQDRMSQVSSRTYKIRTIGPAAVEAAASEGPAQAADENVHPQSQSPGEVEEFDENGNKNNNSKRPAAWIFDPRDGSSTTIVPPARPRGPEAPRVDSKTEELVQARGGRSYYLELVEPGGEKAAAAAKRQRPNSIDSLYSRWNSQGALDSTMATSSAAPYRPLGALHSSNNNKSSLANQRQYKSTRQINSTIAQQQEDRLKAAAATGAGGGENSTRRQLPFSGPPPSLGDKSKSSSCLLSVTKPSKYSIYGGFRRPGETNKPVPRLSYSRAIGPRSQRIDGQPKPTPSRYLKMR